MGLTKLNVEDTDITELWVDPLSRVIIHETKAVQQSNEDAAKSAQPIPKVNPFQRLSNPNTKPKK